MCSYENCNFENYETNNECIFHCPKDDWLTPKTHNWKKNKIQLFWEKIREHRNIINNKFIGFIFPQFEKTPSELTYQNQRFNTADHTCIDQTNFGLRGGNYRNFYSILNNMTSFKDSTFMDDADFLKIYLIGINISFESVIFKKDLVLNRGTYTQLNFNNSQFNNQVNFDSFNFSSCAFNNTVFLDKVSFENTVFTHLNFAESIFEHTSNFKGVTFTGSTNFSKTLFKKAATFKSSSFGGDAVFSETKFDGDAVFTDSNFNGNADFSTNVILKGKAIFDVDHISGIADFSTATFYDVFTFEEVKVNGDTNFSNSTFKKNANFKNGSFEKNSTFSEATFNSDAIFTQREFKGDADFSSGITIKGKALFNVNGITGNANFSESTFYDLFTFEDVKVDEETVFSNSTFKKSANFKAGSFEKHAFFSKAKFHAEAIFTQREFKGNADYSSSEIKGKALFDVNNIIGNADFSSSTFNDEFTFGEVTVSGETKFSNSIFSKDANFQKSSFKAKATFIEITVDGSANFSNSSFSESAIFSQSLFKDDLNFTESSFNSFGHFNNLTSKDIDFNNATFTNDTGKYCSLLFDQSNCGLLDFSSTTIGVNFSCTNSNFLKLDFNYTHILEDCDVEFINVTINDLSFNYFKNKSDNVLFDSVTVSDNLTIKNVTFDKERFNHFNISIPNIEIERSAFNNNFFNSVKWGSISKKRYSASRDIFRQLKFHSEQQKNYIDADGFYSLEMKEQKKELLIDNKKINTPLDKLNHFFSNTLVFYLHEKTSDFSQNWWLPILWLIFVGMIGVIYQNLTGLTAKPYVISYFIVAIVVVFLSSVFKYIQKENLPKTLFYMLLVAPTVLGYLKLSNDRLDDIAKLVNPVNIFKNNSVSTSDEFISLIFKIIVLFLVYQIITAIKKKVRSK